MTGRRAPVRARQALAAALLTGLALLVVLVGGAGPASAHASLVGAAPDDGSTVESAPTKVTLRFDENIRMPSVVVVNGPDGRRADPPSPTVGQSGRGTRLVVVGAVAALVVAGGILVVGRRRRPKERL